MELIGAIKGGRGPVGKLWVKADGLEAVPDGVAAVATGRA